jgi:hypothetical protein
VKGLLVFALALPLAAQLQVYSLQGTDAVLAGASVNLGAVAVSDDAVFPFRVVNGGTAAVPLQPITVNGAGFSLGSSFLAGTLGAGQALDFSVRLSAAATGSYSASLTVNSFTTLLRATVVPGPSLFLTLGGQTSELSASSLQVNVAAGQTLDIGLSVGNPYATPLVLGEISIAGTGFSMVAPATPLTINPGTAVPIPVRIVAGAEGDMSAVLTLGPRRFRIVASVFRPTLAAPSIVLSDKVPRNGQQIKIRLQLAQPALGAGTGILRATFSGTIDDPAIVFPNGTREIQFDVAAGSRDATFGGLEEAVLQTGTTAGTLRLDAITETGITSATYRFDRGPVVIDDAVARRNGSALEIELAGFDNTREVGSGRDYDDTGGAVQNVLRGEFVGRGVPAAGVVSGDG